MNKNLKKAILTSIITVFAAMSFACAAKPTAEFEGQEIKGYTPGTYTGESKGNNDLVKVEVVLDANKIVSVKVVDHKETAGISDPAIAQIPEAIVAGQTLKVDAVTGATYTGTAIVEATALAIESAGGDVASLRK